MYYYCLEEPLIRKNDSEPRSQLFGYDVRRLGSSISLRDICKNKCDILLLSANEVLDYFETDNMMWEIMPEGTAKFMKIHRITQEFIAFFMYLCEYNYLFYEDGAEIILNELIAIHSVIKAIIQGEEEMLEKYKRFCQWMDREHESMDNQLIVDLEKEIKSQVLAQSMEYRRQKDIRTQKLSALFDEIMTKTR